MESKEKSGGKTSGARIGAIVFAVVFVAAIVVAAVWYVKQEKVAQDVARRAYMTAMGGVDWDAEFAKAQKEIDAIVAEGRDANEQAVQLLKKAREATERGDYEEAQRLLKEINGE